MSNLLLINCRPHQRRVAHIENGLTTELFFDSVKDGLSSPRTGVIGQPPTDRPGSAPERRNVDVQQQQQ